VRALLALVCASCSVAPLPPAAPHRAHHVERRERVSSADPPALAAQFHVACPGRGARCPDGVGMLVSLGGEEPNRCTASLVASDRVLTASHCLPRSARVANASCDGTWVAFPQIGAQAIEWVSCARVIEAIDVSDDLTMRRDLAVLELTRPVARHVLPIDPRPPAEGTIVSVLSITPSAIYPRQHELAERLCRVASGESAVATFGPDAANVGWLIDCPAYGGNSGSPILDASGHIRSILHGGSRPSAGIGITSSMQ
jgi:hypothetical protein